MLLSALKTSVSAQFIEPGPSKPTEAQESGMLSALMTKNISEAFQMPIRETFTQLVTQATPQFFFKTDTEPDRTQLEIKGELVTFRLAHAEINAKDFIKQDYFKVNHNYN